MMLRYCIVIANLIGVTLGWHLLMKVPQGTLGGASSVYDLWTSNMTLNPDADNVMSIQPGIPYKSADALNWQTKDISLVKIAFYSGVDEVAYIVFGAAGPSYNHTDWPVFPSATNITSWFDCTRILYSTFSDQHLTSVPEFCSLHSVSTLDHSFSIMSQPIESASDCDNVTGWFTVLEPESINSAIQCNWQPQDSSPPHFMFSPANSSVPFSDAKPADVFAIYVDDCIDKTVCHSPSCWQDPYGNCFCNGFKCTEACSHLPCPEGTKCVTSPKNESNYTCECLYGYVGDRCKKTADTDGLTAAAIAGIVIAILLAVGLITLGIWYFYRWRNRDDQLKQEMTQRAVSAKDFVRRSVHRLSGRQFQFQRKHLKEEKASPPITVKGKSEQLSPDSSIVFGEVNPAFMSDEPSTPQPTPPVDRRYTEFPTRQVPQVPVSVSATEIQLHEKKNQQEQNLKLTVPESGNKRYENLSDIKSRRESPHNFDVYDRASTIGSFEKASTMSEISDATSTSGYSDYTGDTPANLPPSEMISKDVLRHGHHRHKVRSRPRSRASTADPPKLIVAPETPEGQINYAMERSRLSISSLSSMSSEATHKSDSTQRSGELTKSDVLRARYEHVMGYHGEPVGRLSRFDHLNRVEGLSYVDIKRQLDADMSRREARERKLQLEQENEGPYENEKAKKHRMRQVESLDSGIDAENTTVDRNSEGRIHIVRARSADQLDRNLTVNFSSKEATV
ncbi:uncharacterized protein LOC132715096 [Ruditapes philippinarum]|uniref:uncharacterized protein LOC132715096 n=1 Tax=Ruditapes philippinarum TaxID=129788 RepID=UPI00295A8C01|nr:uncharacterized protein LOC132715096 [Ruditapes philippinarum]XP_060554058.1 uncharacterized protein LOC132715096 [Ruditapes philippinarum]XP_060554059.1 uncharacterized protein LOC132715096 [Ruditapes philippinarum]